MILANGCCCWRRRRLAVHPWLLLLFYRSTIGIIVGPSCCWGFVFPASCTHRTTTTTKDTTATVVAAAVLLLSKDSFQQHQQHQQLRCSNNPQHQQHENPKASSFINSNDVVLTVASDCNDAMIQTAAALLIDAYWLGTSRHWVHPFAQQPQPKYHPPKYHPPSSSAEKMSSVVQHTVVVSDAVRESLIAQQAADLTFKYGEHDGNDVGDGGKRLLPSCLILAHAPHTEDDGILQLRGVLSLQVLLLDTTKGDLLNFDQSEEMLNRAVSSFKTQADRCLDRDASVAQRRSVQEVLSAFTTSCATTTTRNRVTPVCCVSNVAVAPASRNQGIATQLCRAAEAVVAQQWQQYNAIYLKVEVGNVAALKLYQDNLHYTQQYVVKADPALRLDIATGEFVETVTETLILSKKLR
jgi:GNAT superfamily N-acetyltransferase